MSDVLGELRVRHRLSDPQADRLRKLLVDLARSPWAPTAVTEQAAALEIHVADSLTALELPLLGDRETGRSVVDLGSGAGFPGLALAAVLDGSRFTLLESQQRKVRFIAELARSAGIDNARATFSRIEEWREGISRQDLALARALAPAPVVLEYAAPLLRIGGALIEWRGRRDVDAERDAVRVAGLLGLQLCEIRRVSPFPESRDHHLHVYEKVSSTPVRFPRRAGMARRRPLSRLAL